MSSKPLRDVVFRSRVLLEGVLENTIRTSNAVNINELLGKITDKPVYIIVSIVGKDSSLRAHIYGFKQKILDCFTEENIDIDTSKCIENTRKLLETNNIPKYLSIYSFPEELISGLITEELRVVEKREAKPLINTYYLEYLLTNELVKLGYVVDSITVSRVDKDYTVVIRLLETSELPSVIDLSYAAAGIICENIDIEGDISVTIYHGKKKYELIHEYRGDRSKCLALGMIPRILKDYGLVVRKINYEDKGDKFILKLGLKKYAFETIPDPQKILERLHSMLSSMLNKYIIVSIKIGVFGREYRISS
jgi:hypothetical protein